MECTEMLSDASGQLAPLCAPACHPDPADTSGPICSDPVTDITATAESGLRRLLIVEDDAPLARLLGSWLGSKGFDITVAHDGEDALAKLTASSYSLVLLDLNLPGIDGVTMLSRLVLEQPAVPVLVVTGRGRTEDLVGTLEGGADDFLVKPFSLVELLARIRALLRRRTAGARTPAPPQASAGLTIYREEYAVERDGRRIHLTPREFALLDYLVQNAPRPVSRATLMEEVWRTPFDPSTNIVDVYMKYLRDKIDCAGEKKFIRTVRGVGYAVACA